MLEKKEETNDELLTNRTLAARRTLLITSLFCFIVAITPFTAEKISVFGIELSIDISILTGLATTILFFLSFGFIIRVITDLGSADFQRDDSAMFNRLTQTEKYKRQALRMLNLIVPDSQNNKFQSDSFMSLLNDRVPENSEYRDAMISNIKRDTEQHISRLRDEGKEVELFQPLDSEAFERSLIEILDRYDRLCKMKRWLAIPIWLMYKITVFLRFQCLDVIVPLGISWFVIGLLLGAVDHNWFLNLLPQLNSEVR